MCMMRAPINVFQSSSVHKRREKKEAATPFDRRLLEPDPGFKDERITKSEPVKKGFFAKLLG